MALVGTAMGVSDRLGLDLMVLEVFSNLMVVRFYQLVRSKPLPQKQAGTRSARTVASPALEGE